MRQLVSRLWRSSLRATSAMSARLVEIDALGAELGRQEAQEAGARADVGHRRLALDDHAAQRLVKGGVADLVGEQRAVIFDAHGR